MHVEDIIDVEHCTTLVANNEQILIDFWALVRTMSIASINI